ncbi:hypothetical protein D3C73_1662290 [compost metagenome]
MQFTTAIAQYRFHSLRHEIVFMAVFLGGQQADPGFSVQYVIRLTPRRTRQWQ